MRYIVEISGIQVARSPDEMVCLGLGSCIAIALYDGVLRIGALAHSLLPWSNGFSSGSGKFVDWSIKEMLRLMERHGSEKKNIGAKLIGGANIFPGLGSIGEKNIIAGRQTLIECGVKLIGEDVGGTRGRSIEFLTATGEVIVKVGNAVKCIL